MTKIKVFSSKKCNPCSILKRQLEDNKLISNIEFILLEDSPDLFKQYQVRAVPTTILEDSNGTITARISSNHLIQIKKAVSGNSDE